MSSEINEDALKQCCDIENDYRDIENDYRDIENCRRKKFYRDISELSHNRSWKIMKANHYCVFHNKDLML